MNLCSAESSRAGTLEKKNSILKLNYQSDTVIKMSDAVFPCLSMWMERVIFPLSMSLERAFLEYSVQFWHLHFERDTDKLK